MQRAAHKSHFARKLELYAPLAMTDVMNYLYFDKVIIRGEI